MPASAASVRTRGAVEQPLFSAAQSRDQAALLFALAAKMVRMSPELNAVVGIRDTAKQLFCPELGTLYRALSADASTAFGLSPVFIVHDELGRGKGPRSELYEALETATAAQDNPLSIIISTQAPTDADLLSVLIDDAKAENDPRVRLFLWTSDPADDPLPRRRSSRLILRSTISRTQTKSWRWPRMRGGCRAARPNIAISS